MTEDAYDMDSGDPNGLIARDVPSSRFSVQRRITISAVAIFFAKSPSHRPSTGQSVGQLRTRPTPHFSPSEDKPARHGRCSLRRNSAIVCQIPLGRINELGMLTHHQMDGAERDAPGLRLFDLLDQQSACRCASLPRRSTRIECIDLVPLRDCFK